MPIPSDLNGLNAGSAGGGNNEQQQQQAAQQQEKRDMMLNSVLTPEAKERLARIAIVKPEKAAEVGNLILSMAQRGQLTEKVSDDRLKSMLNSSSDSSANSKKTTITFQRKKYGQQDDSDEEYDL